MATQTYGPGNYPANLSISAFRGVVLSNNGGITYSSATALPIGFAQVDLASGDYGAIELLLGASGTHKGVISGSCTAGDGLYAAALGLLHTITTSGLTVGIAVTTSGNNDQSVIEFIPLR